jgi:hypothetical protein
MPRRTWLPRMARMVMQISPLMTICSPILRVSTSIALLHVEGSPRTVRMASSLATLLHRQRCLSSLAARSTSSAKHGLRPGQHPSLKYGLRGAGWSLHERAPLALSRTLIVAIVQFVLRRRDQRFAIGVPSVGLRRDDSDMSLGSVELGVSSLLSLRSSRRVESRHAVELELNLGLPELSLS